MFQIKNFLPIEERNQIFDDIVSNRHGWHFQPATVTTTAEQYRIAEVCYDCNPVRTFFIDKIRPHVAGWMHRLGVNRVIHDYELQLTQTNDGGFFKVHNDDGAPVSATRVFTFVYYLHSLPRKFTGGELYVYNSGTTVIDPEDNSIVIFPSSLMHEVKPVINESKDRANARWTLNGWARVAQ